MGVNKVQFGDGNNVIMDITDSTVTTNNLLNGEVAYGADGNRVVGSVVVTPIEDATVTFTEAQTRINIASGETIATLFGKIKKWLSGLQPVAFAAEDRYLKHSTGLNLSTRDAIDERVDFWIYDQYGVKNIIPSSYSSLPTTVSGVTITSEDDGSLRINGTRTNSDPITITLSENLPNQVQKGGDYDPLMSFSLKTNSSDVSLTAQVWYGSSLLNEKTITNNQTDHFALGVSADTTITIKLNIGGSAGDTYNNKNAYFMLYLGNYSDGTWYPYAMTNRELTLKAMQPNGHIVKNDAGTSLTQRDNLKFVGVYTSDDSTNNKTDVQIVREFQSVADIEALTGEAKKGFQNVDDDVYDAFTASEIGFDNSDTSFTGNDVQEVLEEVDSALEDINIESITKVTITETTGATGNIATSYLADGSYHIISPITKTEACFLRVWASPYTNGLFLTAVNPNTGSVIANTELTISFLLVKIKNAN